MRAKYVSIPAHRTFTNPFSTALCAATVYGGILAIMALTMEPAFIFEIDHDRRAALGFIGLGVVVVAAARWAMGRDAKRKLVPWVATGVSIDPAERAQLQAEAAQRQARRDAENAAS